MDEDSPVTQTTARPPPSRMLVVAAVALLIIVAVAGIVLAKRNSSASPPSPAAAASDPLTSPALSGPTSGPNEVVFATGSDKLPALANDSIVKFSEGARAASGMVMLTTRFASGPNKTQDFALAKERTAAVRHALEANGVKLEKIQAELIEMPASSVTPREADRVALSIH